MKSWPTINVTFQTKKKKKKKMQCLVISYTLKRGENIIFFKKLESKGQNRKNLYFTENPMVRCFGITENEIVIRA